LQIIAEVLLNVSKNNFTDMFGAVQKKDYEFNDGKSGMSLFV
jgi:hypothetical protein